MPVRGTETERSAIAVTQDGEKKGHQVKGWKDLERLVIWMAGGSSEVSNEGVFAEVRDGGREFYWGERGRHGNQDCFDLSGLGS